MIIYINLFLDSVKRKIVVCKKSKRAKLCVKLRENVLNKKENLKVNA